MLSRFAPALFVCLWATGFIGAKLVAPHIEPFTVLTIRFGSVAVILLAVVLVMRVPWPSRRVAVLSLLVGILIHGVYLGGLFWAIDKGMTAGVSALIVSLQPILTALLAVPLLGERVSWRVWVGILIGLGGVVLVLSPGLLDATQLPDGTITAATVAASVLSLIGITAGTLVQKRFSVSTDLRMGALFQYLGAVLVTSIFAVSIESGEIDWAWELIVALLWMCLVLSIGAVSLLMVLLRQKAASSVATLFYLVPVVVALMAWALFGERLTGVQLAGMMLVVFAVALVGRATRRANAIAQVRAPVKI